MEKSITINSKEYKIPEINFKAICEIEDLGVDFSKVSSLKFISGLLAYTIGCDMDTAMNEIEEHIKNGGSLDSLNVLVEAVYQSSFFQQMMKKNNQNK